MPSQYWQFIKSHPASSGAEPVNGLRLWPWKTAVAVRPADSSWVDIHPALGAVRQRPEFRPPAPGWFDALKKHPVFQDWAHRLDVTLQRMVEALSHFLAGLGMPGVASKVPLHIREVFYALLAFLALLAILYLAYLFLGVFLRGYAMLRAHSNDTLPAEKASVILSSRRHWREALQVAERGEFAEGVRHLHLASLSLLDERRLVPFNTARSDGEYQRMLAALPETRKSGPSKRLAFPPLFDRLTNLFEKVRYGGSPVNLSGFRQSEEIYRQLRDSLE